MGRSMALCEIEPEVVWLACNPTGNRKKVRAHLYTQLKVRVHLCPILKVRAHLCPPNEGTTIFGSKPKSETRSGFIAVHRKWGRRFSAHNQKQEQGPDSPLSTECENDDFRLTIKIRNKVRIHRCPPNVGTITPCSLSFLTI